MILVKYLWDRISAYGGKYMNGLNVVEKFNTSLAEVQTEVYSDLSPFWQTNEKVRGILEPWSKKLAGTAANSLIDAPTTQGQFDRITSLMVVDDSGVPQYEINPLIEAELGIIQRIPQRKPNAAKKRVYYIPESQSIVATPNLAIKIRLYPTIASLKYLMYYLVYPYEAKIAFTLTETDDEFVMTYDAGNSKDLAWNQDATNIILYKMLEKYGISNRDAWVEEYSRLGVQQTMAGGMAK